MNREARGAVHSGKKEHRTPRLVDGEELLVQALRQQVFWLKSHERDEEKLLI